MCVCLCVYVCMCVCESVFVCICLYVFVCSCVLCAYVYVCKTLRSLIDNSRLTPAVHGRGTGNEYAMFLKTSLVGLEPMHSMVLARVREV